MNPDVETVYCEYSGWNYPLILNIDYPNKLVYHKEFKSGVKHKATITETKISFRTEDEWWTIDRYSGKITRSFAGTTQRGQCSTNSPTKML